jgi:hypothetical protein
MQDGSTICFALHLKRFQVHCGPCLKGMKSLN